METYNFHLYIGSKARIAELHGPEMNDILMEHSCDIMGISDSMYSEGPIILIQHGTEGETEFFLSEAKLILRPKNDKCTMEEQKDYLTIDLNENRNRIFNQAAKIAWFIKNGFDVGLIPEDKFMLTTDLSR